MAVKKEGTGRRPWRCRYKDETGRKRMSSFPTKALAEAFERQQAERKAAVRAGLPVERGPVTYRELVRLVMAGRPSSLSDDWLEGMLSRSVDEFGDAYVRAIQPDHVAAWLNELTNLRNGKPLARKTRQHVLDAMRQVFNLGVEWGYLSKSPVRKTAVRNSVNHGEATEDVQPFESWAEVVNVADQLTSKVKHARRVDAAIVLFAAATGLRPEEWCALRWCDVGRDELRVNRTWTARYGLRDAGKTPGALRDVVLSTLAVGALDTLPRQIDQSKLVFPALHGSFIRIGNWRRRTWYPALTWAATARALELWPVDSPEARTARAEFVRGYRRPPYQLRHTYATLALAAGCTLEWISEQMGHTDIRTTRTHYARFVRRVHDRERAKLNTIGEEHDVEALSSG